MALAVLLLWPAVPTRALDPGRAITQYAHAVWRAPHALPHDDVTAILHGRDGYVWVGTVEGLARFDGVRSTVFDKSNTPAFTNNWVKALLEDRSGRLWVGTLGGGLLCREGGRFTRHDTARGMPFDVVAALLEDRSGRIWAGTYGGGLLKLEGDRFVREAGTEALARASLRALAEDATGTLWIGTEEGLYSFKAGHLSRLTRADGLSDDRVLALAVDAGGVWIGTERGGLNRLSAGRLTTIGTRDGLSHERVWSLATDHDGNLWIGTDGGGLDRLSRGKLSSFSSRNGLDNDYVWAIREDREGHLWVGTNGGGLHQLKDGLVIPVTTREGLSSNFTWAVGRTRDGSLWVGSEDSGLTRLLDGKATTLTTAAGLSSNQVKALAEDSDGTLWVGGGAGVDQVKDGRVVGHLRGLEGERINALRFDSRGGLWIGADQGSMWRYAAGALEPARPAWDRSRGLITLLPASDGTIYAGTLTGLWRSKDGSWTLLDRARGLPNSYVAAIAEDPEERIWVGTRGGLALVSGDRLRSIGVAGGLHDDAIMLLLPDRAGGLWLGGNGGLFRVERRELLAVIEGRRQVVGSRVFRLEDGLPSVEINGSASSAFESPDGRVWFATRSGVASLDSQRLPTNLAPPPVVVEEVFADELPLQGPGPFHLPPGTRRLSFRFTALGLSAPARQTFWRELEGFDTSPVPVGFQRTADYTNLGPGSYRFRVTAANEDGVASRGAAQVEFDVAARWYETFLFRSAVVAFFAFAGPLFYVARVRLLRRQKAVLERLVQERTAELEAASAKLEQLSLEDPLTGLANRRRLDQALDDECRRATRQKTALGAMLVDVDFFKPYNDLLGHQAGDECLRTVAQALVRDLRRAGELVARYGGEEFMVLAPGASREEWLEVAEHLRSRVQGLAIPNPGAGAASVVTVSIGSCWTAPGHSLPASEVIALADRALYRAKARGRNRVESEEVLGD